MIKNIILRPEDLILVTGANGFIGSHVVRSFLFHGFRNIRCFVRPSSDLSSLQTVLAEYSDISIDIVKGNLLVKEDCERAANQAVVVVHLAAGRGKSFSGCFLNSAVATRNLLDAIVAKKDIKRFLNVSSFAVYSNSRIKRGDILVESCPIESDHMTRFDPYAYGKIKQDELVLNYHMKYSIPYVIVRPGVVFGPGRSSITGRVGTGTFGIFLHLGGSNYIPFTYVDNCADAIVLAATKKGVDKEVFNIVDDDLPKSREFLGMYKKQVRWFLSLSVSYSMFFILCYIWEKYAAWSKGQLPPSFNRKICAVYWKGNRYSNEKLKNLLEWEPRVPMKEALQKYFIYSKKYREHY